MIKFLKISLIFFLPLIIWCLLILCVDPFNYFNISKLVTQEKKELNALELNPLLYEALECLNHPSENMLIGDSRTLSLPTPEIKRISGIEYKKIIAKSARLNEIFDLIYFANSKKKLKRLVVGINFNMFNRYFYDDRISDIEEIIANPLKYVFNRSVAEACYYVIRSSLTGENVIRTPPMSREKFWDWNIKRKAFEWYGKYQFPDKLNAELFKLDSFAKANNIDLTFIIVPHHRQFHDRLVELGLSKEEEKFVEIMSSLSATVIDYDYENSITIDKNNFRDPVHYNEQIGIIIADEVWKKNYKIGRLISAGKQ